MSTKSTLYYFYSKDVTKSDNTVDCRYGLGINKYFYKNFNTHPYSQNSAMLTSGNYYMDAISAGPLAAITYSPIVFIKGNSPSDMKVWDNEIDDSLKNVYTDVSSVYYLGGTGVVPDGAEKILNGEAIN